ncbi:variant erythrocyte surface antigen-1 family protein, partial [Babesia divergens]
MVCYMYYTDVFVGTGNINNLKDALKAELKGSVLNVDLTQLESQLDPLASGLGNFIGYSGGRLKGDGIGKNGLTAQKFSSYDPSEATWKELCEKCQCKEYSSPCSCSCRSSGVCSNPSKCCDNCDVRKAAKIFLGMLPCLYYALKYLFKQCEGDWKTLKISDKDYSPGHFLSGMGYELQKLENKTGGEISGLLSSLFTSGSKFKDLYEKSQNYFTSSSPSPVPSSDSDSKPETVREILLWLSGLPFTSGFKDLLKHCERLCKPVASLNFDNFESSLFNSCFLSPFVLGVIEEPTEEARKFPPYKSEWQNFSYPEDPFKLFETFCDFVRKIYIPLNFLKFQCERTPAQAGWQECFFGQNCSVSSSSVSSAPSGCTCKGHDKYLCTGSSKHSSCSSSCSSPCPHPLLRFLLDGSENSKNLKNLESPFQPPKDFPPMGFSKQNLSPTAKKGESLFVILDIFVGKANTNEKVCLLRDLLRLLLCLTRTPPSTLGEFFIFFQKFKDPSVFSSKLKDFADYASKEPGFYNGQKFTNALKTALQKLYGSSHSGDHSVASLYSLNGCEGPKGSSNPTCGKYLYPLIQDASDIFGDDFIQTYLSWICYLPKDFKNRLEEFKQKFSSCCSSGSCKSIVDCPCALPLIYSRGFQFHSPNDLNGNDKKSCQDFISQLGKVVGKGSPLQTLLTVIDNFLWSIRLPFVYAFLYIWILLISYFYYVQFYKLDLLHIDSHLHLPRSFKILPSTLFSDASSKLK